MAMRKYIAKVGALLVAAALAFSGAATVLPATAGAYKVPGKNHGHGKGHNKGNGNGHKGGKGHKKHHKKHHKKKHHKKH
jgi:hypothetical protein